MMMAHGFEPTPISVGYLDKCVPGLPNVTFETGEGRTGPLPNGVVLQCNAARKTPIPRARIPQFRQSRRWARMHGWGEPPTPPPHPLCPRDSFLDNNPSPDDVKDQQLSKREISFEQQRALPKQALLQRANPVGESKRPNNDRTITSSTSDSQHGCAGCNRPAECWRLVKPTVMRFPRAGTKVWSRKRSKSRKATAARRRDAGRGSAAIISLPTGVRRGKASRALQREGTALTNRVTSSLARRRPPSGLRGRSNRQNEVSRSNLAISLIPSLHDPLKDRAFSDECREMLRSLGSHNDWLRPIASGSDAAVGGLASRRSLPATGRDLTQGTAQKPASLQVRHSHPHLQEDTNRGDENVVAGPVRSSAILQHTGPLAKPSSATLESLTSMHHANHTESASHSTSENVPAGSDARKQPIRHQKSAMPSLQPKQARLMMRLSSARSVMSTDTLASIEAQVHGDSQAGIDSVLKSNSLDESIGSAVQRYSGPPPNIPLPALPPEAQDQQSDAPRSVTDDGSLLHRGESSATSVEFTRHKIRGPRAESVRARRLRDLADLRGRATKSTFRKDDEIAPKRMPADIDRHPGPVNEISDELDRFPAVPDSRPTSMSGTSVQSAHSRQQSPPKKISHQLRRVSTVSSAGHRSKPPCQVLSQSNIFVVVDSDPVTARFRAGAMSPTPSMGGSSPERRTPRKVHKPSRLKEVIVDKQSPLESSRNGTTLRSPKGQQILTPGRPASHPSGSNKRPATSDSRHQLSPSEEHSPTSPDPALSNKRPGKSKKRRRWNSGDINLIKLLNQDLEMYYSKIREQEEILRRQEEKIKWQTHQIQMMSRAFAPMSRHRSVMSPPILEDSPELPPMTVETQPLGAINRSSWSGSRDWRQRNIGLQSSPTLPR
ncbi:hypothetical protein PV04_03057 [Phialophora macrospora]|uniref:Uncharacterized protein n=1 Tax=Phialophora macrospora TaxID=1851006 RepID=A0A0D2FR30_9EURO|nr:hypothetical protein PV04_03057 [Phialophora macrospora]